MRIFEVCFGGFPGASADAGEISIDFLRLAAAGVDRGLSVLRPRVFVTIRWRLRLSKTSLLCVVCGFVGTCRWCSRQHAELIFN